MKIRITKCSDSLMWYAALVGKEMNCTRVDADGYWCREPSGFLNVVKRADAEVIAE